MFKRLSAVVMAAALSAMLCLTVFAEVDREAVEKKLVEYQFEGNMACDYDGYHVYVEDNPFASVYYEHYIEPFIKESSEERLGNLDLSDETDHSISRFVKFWYWDWESEQSAMLDSLINDGNRYEFERAEEDKWIVRELGGGEKTLDIEKTDTSFIFTTNGKKLGEYERLFKYSYLNDEDAIAIDKEIKEGNIDKFDTDYPSSEEYVQDVYEVNSEEPSSQRAVTPELVSEVDNIEENHEEVAVEVENVQEAPKKSNAPLIAVGGIVLVTVGACAAYFIKKGKAN